MTEQLPDPAPTVAPADFDAALDDWIAGASLTRRAVTIYSDKSLAAEHQLLSSEYEKLQADPEPDLGSVNRKSEIYDRLVELAERWDESKAEWIVEDISSVIDEVAKDAGPPPEPPEPLDEPVLRPGASDAQKRAHQVAMQRHEAAKPGHAEKVSAYEDAAAAWGIEYALHLVARATVEIRFANGTTSQGVTVEQLRRMRGRVGDLQIKRLADEARIAMVEEPVIEAPFSPTPSPDDQT